MSAAVGGCGEEPVVRCVGERTLERCEGDDCEEFSCRGDELCQEDSCVAWQDAALHVDFTLVPDAREPLGLRYEVAAGGFPREFLENVRVDFGDLSSGWGEAATHVYEAAGVYAVDLEVILQGYRVLRASQLAVLSPSLDHNPLFLTVNDIPAHLNGSTPYKSNAGTADPEDDAEHVFHLLVPTHGFTVDLTLLEASPVDRQSISLTADAPLAGGLIPAGQELADRFVFEDGRVTRASWFVTPEDAFAEGLTTLTLSATTQDGVLHSTTLRFEAEALPPERRVFDRAMTWLLVFDRDYFTTTGGVNDNGTVAVDSELGPDGVPDFAAELALFGAQSDDPAPGAASVTGRGQVGASAVFLAWVKQRIAGEIHRYFKMRPDGTPTEGIQFEIIPEGELDAPDPADFNAEGGFSMLRLGGTLGDYLGRSFFGVYNEERIDDTTSDLGVATGTILGAALGTGGLTDALDGLKPGIGTPVGEDPLDAVVLRDSFDRYSKYNTREANERYDTLHRAAWFIALAISNVAAHEMGHAMGLMPNGPPPDGFFGGRPDVSFGTFAGRELAMGEHTDSHHADFPGLNLMQAGGNLLDTVFGALNDIEHPRGYDLIDLAKGFAYENRLSPYELAYMQGRLTYRNFNGPTALSTRSIRK